jgi:RecA-family ATPase
MTEHQKPLSNAFGTMNSDATVSRFIADRNHQQDVGAANDFGLPMRSDWLGEPVDLQHAARVANQPVDYVAAPIFRSGRASLITGLGASSKSTLLKTLAVAVATGRSVLGMTIPRPGKAVLLLAEDTVEDAQRSIHAIFASMNLTPAEFEVARNRLRLFPLAGKDCVLVDPESPQGPGRLQELLRMVKGMGDVRFIGLDPAIALTRGRELDETAQRSLANAVENLAIESGAAVVLVSHAAKSIQFQHEISSHASRGSGAITDAFRLEVVMRVMTSKEAQAHKVPEEGRHQYVKFQVSKANSLAPELMRPKWLRRIEGGALALATLETPVARAEDRKLRAMALFLQVDGETGESTPIALDRAKWKKRALEAKLLTGSTQEARDMSASRLLSSLRDYGWIRERDGLFELTSEGLNASGHALG